MKRYGEKAIREALNDGVIIRDWDWFTLQAGYKVIKGGETIGYITFDLFCKLLHDGTIAKTRSEYSYVDYAIVIEGKESATEERIKDICTYGSDNDGHKIKVKKGKNDMQTKKVFSAAKYLSVMMKLCNDEEIQLIIIPAINPKGWVWKCDGKTPEECKAFACLIADAWCIEIPQNENIDFWRNYTK